MEESLQIIKLGASVLITVIIISLAIRYTDVGQNISSNVIRSFNSVSNSMTEREYMKYDGAIVGGSDVMSCIRKHKKDITVEVIRLGSNGSPLGSIFFQGEGTITSLPSSAKYINPAGKFLGKIVRNSNEAITSIVFKQQNITSNSDGSGGGSGVIPNPTPDHGGNNPDGGNIDVSSILTMLTSLQNAIELQRDQLTELKETIQDSDGSSGGSGETPEDVKSSLDGIKSSILELQISMEVLKDAISNSDGSGSNGNPSGDPSEIENLKDSVSALSASLIALSEEIAGMKNNQATKDDLDAINNSISSIQSTLDILKDKIDSLTEEGAKPTPTDTPNSKSISEKSSGFVKMISDSSEIAEEGDTWVIGDNVKARVENNCLYVTGNGSTFRFTSRNAVPWYHLAHTITKVKIDSSVDVKYLDWWFSKTSIKNIILPDSVISLIGTFYDCTKLEKCSFIPASVQVMDYCFYNCNQLKGNIDCLSDFVHSMSNFYTGKDLSISVSADTVSFRTMEEYCLNNSERGVSIVGK